MFSQKKQRDQVAILLIQGSKYISCQIPTALLRIRITTPSKQHIPYQHLSPELDMWGKFRSSVRREADYLLNVQKKIDINTLKYDMDKKQTDKNNIKMEENHDRSEKHRENQDNIV